MKTIRLYHYLGLSTLLLLATSNMGLAQSRPPLGGGGGVQAAQGAAAVQGAQNAAARAQAIGSTAQQAARAGETFQGNPRFDRTVLGRGNNRQAGGQPDGQGDGQGTSSTGGGFDSGFS